MENKDGKHIWENEGWESMEKLLDKDMPVRNGIWESPLSKLFVFALCLLSFGFWLFPNINDWTKERNWFSESVNSSADLSDYKVSTASDLPDVIPASNTSGLLPSFSANDFDNDFGARYYDPLSKSRLTFGSLSEYVIQDSRRSKGAGYISYNNELSELNLNRQIATLSPHSISNHAIKSDFDKKIYTFSELYYHNGTADLWGGGVLVGVTYKSEQPWRTSLSLGYQLTQLPPVKANSNNFQPLVAPGSQDGNESSSSGNNGVDMNLPDVQLLMHQINLNAQFEWRISSKFSAGAISRLSLNWYDVNPNLADDPVRIFYPDLQYSKTEVKKTHIGVGAGLTMSYDIHSDWSLQTRGLFNKNFVGLNANTAIIENRFWTFETGLRYRF